MEQIDVDPSPRRVFVSHSSRDAASAALLVAALEAQNLPCWIAPRDVPPGSRYGASIISGINVCSQFVLLLSEHSNASPQVLAEVERAVSKGLSIVTVRLESVNLDPSLEYFLSSFHWLDAFSLPFESHLARLTEAIEQSVGGENRPKAPALSVPRSIPNNLPQQATSFVGREQQITEITGRLATTRLLTLTGSGGSGKTRLSLQVAADLLTGSASEDEKASDGIWFVELAPIADPALVSQTVAGVFGIREEAGVPLVKTLVEALKAKSLLLILDNCEHLLAACASLASELSRACPDVRILASSREPLGVPGESVYRVPPLSLPDLTQTPTAVSLAQYESARLMIERAQAARPDFALTDANAPAVAQICCRLDGIPLALELAAARVRAMPVEDVNTRLDNRFRLLTGGSKTLLPRQQTLRALIDWSYDLLTIPEKALLQRLSVFAGGWTLASAERVCSGEDIEDWEVLDLLTALVDKSLVVYAEMGGTGRYHLLETVRQYAGERLDESGTASETRRRHRDAMVAQAEAAQEHLAGPEQGIWLSRLDREHDNLREALAWCEQDADGGTEPWLRLCAALQRFWITRGHFSEGRHWLTRALRLSEGSPPSQLRARALNAASVLARMRGDYEAARLFAERSLAMSRAIEDQDSVSMSLQNLGNVVLCQGNLDAAQAAFEESLSIARLSENHRAAAIDLSNLGVIAAERGDSDTARALYEEALEIERRAGDQINTVSLLGNLGNIALFQGDHASAKTLFEELLGICEHVGFQPGIAAGFWSLGTVATEQNDLPLASIFFEKCLLLSRQIEDRVTVAEALEGFADVAALTGDAVRAGRLWSAAETLRKEIDNPLPSRQRQRQERLMDQTRMLIGDDAFTAALAAGRALTLDQAAAEALAKG